MKISLATLNQAHMISAAGALSAAGDLDQIIAAIPRSRLARDGVPAASTKTFLAPALIDRSINKLFKSSRVRLHSEHWHKALMDAWITRHLPTSDVFWSLSSVATRSGPEAQKRGSLWIVDRPCSHIVTQNDLIGGEFRKHGLDWPGISPSIIQREMEEYEKADVILIASEFSRRSFIEHGISSDKLWVVPYGVNLQRFKPTSVPPAHRFNVLFVGKKYLRKGIPLLLSSFSEARVNQKSLKLVGTPLEETSDVIASALRGNNVEDASPVGSEELAKMMSESHVLVLPSVEDGYGLVVAQAMACSCPCIVSDHAGAADLIVEGVNGYTFRSGDEHGLASALEKVANHPNPSELRKGALKTASQLGGWNNYVAEIAARCAKVLNVR